MSPLRAVPSLLTLFALPLLACDSEVTLQGGGDQGGGCPANSEGCVSDGCPELEPASDASCSLPDFTECRYTDADGCTAIWTCAPVYPEAGAPSTWSYGGHEGDGCEVGCEAPSCPAPYVLVPGCPAGPGDCYSDATSCGEAFFCYTEECFGAPACDAGDTLVPSCPLDAPCYSVTVCGATVTCVDSTMPEHGCPPVVPADGEACDPNAGPTFCDYPTSPGCFESWQCEATGWTFAGGGCAGG